MIFKICGLRAKDSLICCEANNVNFFGLIFYKKSPRNIDFKDAKELVNFSQNLKIKPVGVFVNHEINDLKDIISSLSLKYIQLHGDENQDYISEIKKSFDIFDSDSNGYIDLNELKEVMQEESYEVL